MVVKQNVYCGFFADRT